MHKKIAILILLSFTLVLYACQWEETDPITELPENVSFQMDLIPIFNESCNMSGCHPSGGIPPDLSVETSYESIIALDLVDTLQPQESTIYKRMTDTQKPMPTQGLLSASKTNLILVWIQEGAKNN